MSISLESFVDAVLAATIEDATVDTKGYGVCALGLVYRNSDANLVATGERLGLTANECYGVMDGWDSSDGCSAVFSMSRSVGDGDEYERGFLFGVSAYAAVADEVTAEEDQSDG